MALGAPVAELIELDKRITHTGRVSPTTIDHCNLNLSPNPFTSTRERGSIQVKSSSPSITGIHNDAILHGTRARQLRRMECR